MARTITDFEYDPKTDTLDRPQNRYAKERLNASRADEAAAERRRSRQVAREEANWSKRTDTGQPEAKPKAKTPPLSEMDKARAAANKQNAKIDSKAKSFLRTPRTLKGGVKALGRGAMNVGKGALSVPGLAAAATNELSRGFLRDTEKAQNIQTGIADYAADKTGVASLQDRLLSDDPAVVKAAIAEEKQQRENPSLLQRANNVVSDFVGKRGDDSMLMSGLKSAASALTRPGQGAESPQGAGQPTQVATAGAEARGQAGPPTDDDATVIGIAEQSRPANNQVNAANPEPVAGSSYEFAGKYGDTNVITRPTMDANGQPVLDPGARQRVSADGRQIIGAGGQVVDTATDPNRSGQRAGQPVPEFTDYNTANGLQRPPQTESQIAAENARVEQARADYTRNTTMSDGRRAFGGSATEKLRAMQMEQAGRGDPDGTVSRQLAEEGLTPEQRAAYAADPAGAYQVDASAKAANAASQLSAFKDQFNAAKAADASADRKTTEKRRFTTDEAKKIEAAFSGLALTAPKSRAKLMLMANEMVENGQGSATEVLNRIYQSIQFDENNEPLIDPDTGSFVLNQNAELESPSTPMAENQVYL